MAVNIPRTSTVRAAEILPVLRANGMEEFIQDENHWKPQDFIAAWAHDQPVSQVAIDFIKAINPAWFTNENKDLWKTKPVYVLVANRGGNEDGGAGTSADPRLTDTLNLDIYQIYNKSRKAKRLDANGRPTQKATHTPFTMAAGQTIDPAATTLPDFLKTDEFLATIDGMAETNGMPCYNAEAFALGVMSENEYFLFPDDMPYTERSIDSICCPKPPVNPLIFAQIYTLNKNQALQLRMTEAEARAWAFIRVQAYSAGWFDLQQYTRFEEAPKDSYVVWNTDWKLNRAIREHTWALVAFVPFLHEVKFRTTATTYSDTNAADYEANAANLAQSSTLKDALLILPGKYLFKSCLRWIGVERVMRVLQRPANHGVYPRVFWIRRNAPPSGQAVLSAAGSVIESMEQNSHWRPIKEFAKWDDAPLLAGLAAVKENPFKYHMMHTAYAIAGPTNEERAVNEAAVAMAIKFAPILQAYVSVYLATAPINKNKVLQKHAGNNGATTEKFKKFFSYVRRKNATNLTELFAMEEFGLVPAAPEPSKAGPSKRRRQFYGTRSRIVERTDSEGEPEVYAD